MIKLVLVRHGQSMWNPICYELDDNLKPIKHYYLK